MIMAGTFSIIVVTIMAMIAVSYAWGMRGDLIGGEEGAMLPGAVLGFFVALLLGKGFFDSSALLFVALGITGMFIGGTEPYAQTFHYTYWTDEGIKTAPNLKKGMLGLAIKGAPWFGICAAVLGVGLSAASGLVYKTHQLVILAVLLPLVRFVGVRLLNDPIDAEKGVFPKYYFSETSREEWGGLWFMLMTFLVFEALCNDFSSVVITICGMIGGSVGWIIAQLAQCFTKVRMKNGKYLFGDLQEQGRIDNWKIMEFLYGALGSLGVIVGFIICKNKVNELSVCVTLRGANSFLSESFATVLFIIWLVLFVADVTKRYLPSQLDSVKNVLEVLHRPVLCYIPMLLLFLGNTDVAKFMALTVLFWQALEELCFVQLQRRYNILAPSVVCYILLAIMAIYTLLLPYDGINVRFFYFFICFIYLLCASFANIAAVYGLEGKSKNIRTLIFSMGSFITVKLYYVFCIIFSTIFLIFY